MPRIQPHIFSKDVCINCKQHHCIVESHKHTPKTTTFVLLPETKREVILPARWSSFKQTLNGENSFVVQKNGEIIYYGMDCGQLKETNRFSPIDFPIASAQLYSVFTDSYFIVAHYGNHSAVVNAYSYEVQRFNVKKVQAYERICIFFDPVHTKYVAPVIINNTVQCLDIPVPYSDTYVMVPVINTDVRCLFITQDCIYKVSITESDSGAEVHSEKLCCSFLMEHAEPKSAFFLDDLCFIQYSTNLVAYSFDEGEVKCYTDVSGNTFMSFTFLNGEVYGMIDSVMYPLTVERNIAGYGIIADMRISLTETGSAIRTPAIASCNHIIHIDVFSENPSAMIHGVVEGNCSTLTQAGVQIRDKKKFVAFKDGQIHCEYLRTDMEHVTVEYSAGCFTVIENCYNQVITVGDTVINTPFNNWFDVTSSCGGCMWVSGSSYLAFVSVDDAGVVLDFAQHKMSTDMHYFCIPNLYSPYICLSEQRSEMKVVVYDAESKEFNVFSGCHICGNQAFSSYFVNDRVFFIEDQLFRFTGEEVEQVHLNLPWDFINTTQFTYQPYKWNSVMRLHMKLDRYDVVYDLIVFDESFTSFTIFEKRVSILDLLTQNSEFYPVSEIKLVR
ncbi:hypothetical protein PCE1_004695 [Barthelona sp. PCE]